MDWGDVEEEEEANEEEEGRAKADPDQHDLERKIEKNKRNYLFLKKYSRANTHHFSKKKICGWNHS